VIRIKIAGRRRPAELVEQAGRQAV